MLTDISESDDPHSALVNILDEIHSEGRVSGGLLERLSLYKEFHPDEFNEIEEKIVSSLGLFYKNPVPKNLYSFIMSRVGEFHKEKYGKTLTPVQASVRRAIDGSKFISISAPTSAGKSYSIREFLASEPGDAVVVVPSRALIAEYLNAMKRRFGGDKTVMILPFVDAVFKSRQLRHIYVLTPERARDLFSMTEEINPQVFFFDEAQISEERERGVVFDVLVRRVVRHFPNAKLIFAHPFVENPDAQLKKHSLNGEGSYSHAYSQGAVGKLHVFQHSNGRDFYFSPYEKRGHRLQRCVEFAGGFENFALRGDHSILVYVTKGSIYSGRYLDGFKEYINNFDDIDEPEALRIISAIEHIVGADQRGHRSKMIGLLRKGVVIHHGSVPLEVRFLLEDFVRGGFARICFATSTLVQGVNMPFDIVWMKSMRLNGGKPSDKALALKNLIGRAGRLSDDNVFDYGYVYTKRPKEFSEMLRSEYALSETSVIDAPEVPEDSSELVHSIREGTFNDELHVPESKVERLSNNNILDLCELVVDIIYGDEGNVSDNLGGAPNRTRRETIEVCLRGVFEASLGRSLLDGEQSVFRVAISIMLQSFQGRSFREIVGTRYSRITRRDEGRIGYVEFSQQANGLPDSRMARPFPVVPAGTRAEDVSYDTIVFDTYDYLDKVIAFSLSDVFFAAFSIYHKARGDERALKFIELVRFGTNDALHVLLMRYGFLAEDIEEITPYIQSISEDGILFRRSIEGASERVRSITEWYR